MIAKSYILKNLSTIESLYSDSTSIKKGLLYSKLAILELCGWIEESMDDMIRTCSNRHLRDVNNRKFVENPVIKKTYGFEYDRHFRRMLIQTIGIIKLEKLERKLDAAKFQRMQATLKSLRDSRDSEAHTHIRGVTKRLNAPSVTRNSFLIIYEGLRDIDDKLRRMKL
jgi:hypothetical protein